MKIINNDLIMMFNILSFFNVRNVKNYLNSNNNKKNIEQIYFGLAL